MLEGIPFDRLTAPGLVGIFVLLMFFGKIVPRIALKEKSEECERWRKAYEAEREARATSDAQTAELLELAQTTHKILVAMFGAAEQERRSGGPHVVPSQR